MCVDLCALEINTFCSVGRGGLYFSYYLKNPPQSGSFLIRILKMKLLSTFFHPFGADLHKTVFTPVTNWNRFTWMKTEVLDFGAHPSTDKMFTLIKISKSKENV